MSKTYGLWAQAECHQCGTEFLFTRTEERTVEDDYVILCGECETWARAEKECEEHTKQLRAELSKTRAELGKAQAALSALRAANKKTPRVQIEVLVAYEDQTWALATLLVTEKARDNYLRTSDPRVFNESIAEMWAGVEYRKAVGIYLYNVMPDIRKEE